MARVARFTVDAKLDGADGATVEIDRDTGIVTVRPKRRQYVATVTLAWVAEAALWQRAKALAASAPGRRRARR